MLQGERETSCLKGVAEMNTLLWYCNFYANLDNLYLGWYNFTLFGSSFLHTIK